MDDLTIRPITAEEMPAFVRADWSAYSMRPTDAEMERSRLELGAELERTLATFDGDQIVATASALSFDLTLPGLTTLPAAGVTWVAVAPTHRRRGLLTALMRRQLADVRARGEALAVLTASESVIYGRFGYGLATSLINIEMDRRHTAFAREWHDDGRISLIEHEPAMSILPELYERWRQSQPGALTRNQLWWQLNLRDPLQSVDGFGPRFYVTHTNAAGEVDGAATYRVMRRWEYGLAGNILHLRNLITTTPEARAAIWRFCFGVDLVGTIQAVGLPVDEPLRWMLADPRRMRVTTLFDNLWLRILDVPEALSARRYGVEGGLVLEISDAFRPEQSGRYELEAGPEGALCRPTTRKADLELSVADLAAAYLGGVRLATLAGAGRVRELRASALARANQLFATERPPYCDTDF